MGDLIPFRRKEPTPEQRAYMIQRLTDLEIDIDIKYLGIETLERERERLRRAMGYITLERGVENDGDNRA